MDDMRELEAFARDAAEYLQHDPDCGDYGECYRNALENPDDTYNYLWWLNNSGSRKICIAHSGIV